MRRKLLVVFLVSVFISTPLGKLEQSRATIPVIDYSLISLTQINHAIDQTMRQTFHGEDIAKYATMISKQILQITNQVTQITNQLEQLRRLGDPNYYVNMLGLNQILASINRLELGVGSVLSEIQASANGFSALRYTAQGLYSDLTQMKDQFGNSVAFNQNYFRKFGAVYDLSDRYNSYLQSYNQNAQSLGQDVQQTMNRLNSERTQIGAEKLRGQMQALQLQQQAAAEQAQIAANKVTVQHILNQTNDAQMREAVREKEFQDTVMQNQSTILSGNLMTNSLPLTGDMGPLKLQ
jgi:hypothetical protein